MGNIGEDGGLPSDQPSWSPEPAVLPRMTSTQYKNALTDLFGSELPKTALEPDTNPYLFYSIGAASTSLSELGVQQLEEAADLVTRTVLEDAERRVDITGCEPEKPG